MKSLCSLILAAVCLCSVLPSAAVSAADNATLSIAAVTGEMRSEKGETTAKDSDALKAVADGNWSTQFFASSDTQNGNIVAALSAPATINQVILKQGNSVRELTCSIDVSLDGKVWENAVQAEKTKNPIITFDIDYVQALYVRFNILKITSVGPYKGFSISEFEIYGESTETNDTNSGAVKEPQNNDFYHQHRYDYISEDQIQAIKNSLTDGVAMAINNSKAIVDTNKVSIDSQNSSIAPRIIDDIMYIPAKFTAERLEGTYAFDSEAKTVTISSGENRAQYRVETAVRSDDAQYHLVSAESDTEEVLALDIDGVLYVPAAALAELFGKQCYTDERGFVVISNDVSIYEFEAKTALDTERNLSNWVVNRIVFDGADEKQILKDFSKTGMKGQHPRVLANTDKVNQMIALSETDERMKKYYNDIIQQADSLLPIEPPSYQNRNQTMNRIRILAMAYQLTKDAKYGARGWKEIELLCSYPNWTPAEVFDLSYYSKAAALAYDWFYDYMTPQQRKILKNAMVEKSLNVFLSAHQTASRGGENGGNDTHHVIINTNHNITQNTGAIMLALALLDEKDVTDKCAEVIASALKGIEYYLPYMAMFGSGKESIYYWYYPMESTVETIRSLEGILGSDYGISNMPGMEVTGNFPIHMTGSTGMAFNWGNAQTGYYVSSEVTWLGNRYGDKTLSAARMNGLEDRNILAHPYDLLYYEPEKLDTDFLPTLDKTFGRTESVGMFSALRDSNALYVGLKGGYNNDVHNALSTGAFVLDALGERWAWLIGQEDYSVPGYWNYSENGQRWTYYRMRAEAQNALVINPGDKPDQYPFGYSKIEKFESKPRGAYAIIDATPAFATDNKVKKVRRGAFLTENRTKVIIQDEIEATNSNYYFMMQTQADIQIQPDGKTAILERNGKKMFVELQSTNPDAKFATMDAVPLSTSPHPEQNSPNNGVRKLVVNVKNTNDLTVSVIFTPLANKQSNITSAKMVGMDNWEIPDGDLKAMQLESLTVDGKTIEGFAPNRTDYKLFLPHDYPDTIPEVVATSEFETTVTLPKELPGTATVTMTDAETNRTVICNILMQREQNIGVKASAVPEPENPPTNTLDYDLETRWAAEGEQWIEYDLKEPAQLESVSIAWASGNARKAIFDIEVSVDGENWTKVWGGESSGATLDFEEFSFNAVQAQYVKIVCHGNSVSKWNSINEIQFKYKK